jgi:hypothetical protein
VADLAPPDPRGRLVLSHLEHAAGASGTGLTYSLSQPPHRKSGALARFEESPGRNPMRRRTRNAPATGMTPRLRPDSGARLAARCQEEEEAVIRILVDAPTSPASLVQRFGSAAIPSDQIRKMISRAADIAAAFNGSSEETSKARSRARREGHRRGEDDHHQAAARPSIGPGCRVIRIGGRK